MSDIYITGVGMTKFGRHIERSYKDLVREAVEQALTDALFCFLCYRLYAGSTHDSWSGSFTLDGLSKYPNL